VAAEIREQTGVEADLIEGGGGIFDVVVDGARVFSKRVEGRFPEPGELSDRLGA
jgi:predicted Rdx family selenoprotein